VYTYVSIRMAIVREEIVKEKRAGETAGKGVNDTLHRCCRYAEILRIVFVSKNIVLRSLSSHEYSRELNILKSLKLNI